MPDADGPPPIQPENSAAWRRVRIVRWMGVAEIYVGLILIAVDIIAQLLATESGLHVPRLDRGDALPVGGQIDIARNPL